MLMTYSSNDIKIFTNIHNKKMPTNCKPFFKSVENGVIFVLTQLCSLIYTHVNKLYATTIVHSFVSKKSLVAVNPHSLFAVSLSVCF